MNNMAEYIACRECNSSNCKGCNMYTLEMMLDGGKFDCIVGDDHSINPLADVAKVVRCKDCKHFAEFCGEAKEDGADGTCRLLIMKVVENDFSSVRATDFCSYGERKE